jgi:hypothetical protein
MSLLAAISMERGVVSKGDYEVTRDSNISKVHVFKQENEQLKFKVSIFYSGIIEGHPSWICQINDKPLMQGNSELSCTGSTKFVFKPVDAETLEIQETAENKTGSLWVDLSGRKTYQVYKTPPLSSEKIEALIKKGGLFTADDKKAEAILYNRHAGAFLLVENNVYHAKKSLEFTQCSANKMNHPIDEFVMVAAFPENGSEAEDSAWEVKFPGKVPSHVLILKEGSMETGDTFIKGASWDETPLKVITLEKGN